MSTNNPRQTEIEAAFNAWKTANCAGNIEEICALYAPDAIFWGTISPFLRTTPDEIRDYFLLFLNPAPIKILHHHPQIRFHSNLALHSGSYTFYFPAQGGIRYIDARYSFAYERQSDGRWLIVDHHSSRMPDLNSN